MRRFLHYLAERRSRGDLAPELILEFITYKKIPGTSASYREDAANTNTKTQRHVHVYAKRDGGGKELYSANIDGSGHDGSTGREIPSNHADYFREKGYAIPSNNILEFTTLDDSSLKVVVIVVVEDQADFDSHEFVVIMGD